MQTSIAGGCYGGPAAGADNTASRAPCGGETTGSVAVSRQISAFWVVLLVLPA